MMLNPLVEKSRGSSELLLTGQQQPRFNFCCRLNQIPQDLQQIAVKLR
jgi:hypothetical protein